MTGAQPPRDLEAWQQAKSLLDQIGDVALETAANAADDFAKKGDEDAALFWEKTRQAVAYLLENPSLRNLIDPPVLPEIDIWRAANQLIKRHGENAALEAAQRADALLDQGDVAGERTFLRIAKAIDWLQNTEGRHPFKVEH